MEKHGRLKVLRHNDNGFVTCQCDCGETTVKRYNLLKIGKTKSCGCLRRENGVRRGKNSTKHGEGSNGKETAEYRAWAAMLSRCNNKNHRNYKNYGARGIKVCERWSSYEAFLDDMGRRPTSKHSLDRIDNDGDYSPENCRWATMTQQNRNHRGNHIVEFRGESMTITEWAIWSGIPRDVLYHRFGRGWTAERALSTPVQKKRSAPQPTH